MSSTRLVLVRHGQHDCSVENGPLTEVGRRQVVRLAAELRVSDEDVLVSSPLRRARETAACLRAAYAIVEGLREFDFGPVAPAAEALVERREDLMRWRADDGFAGGETLAGFQARVGETMESLTAAHAAGRVVASTHAGVLDAALRWAYGIGPTEDWVAEAVVRNASISELEVWREGRHGRGAPRHTVIHRVGDVAYLPPGLVTDI